tara:strand:- start:349 stop:750 length:402 start_codon:yes stop_codon:yes gene_type:complete
MASACLDTAESTRSTTIVLPANFVVWFIALAHASTPCHVLSASPSLIEEFPPSAITAIRIVSLVRPGSLTVSSTGEDESSTIGVGIGVGATGVTVGGGETDGTIGSEQDPKNKRIGSVTMKIFDLMKVTIIKD